MALYTAAQRAILQNVADYLQGNHDLPIPEEVVNNLAKVFQNTAGFACICGSRGPTLRASLKNEPIRTFIRLLIATSDAATGGTLPATPSGVLPP